MHVPGSPFLAHMMSENVGPRKHDDPTVVDRVNRNSPEIDESKVTEDQTCMKLLPLLEPSSPGCHIDSPGTVCATQGSNSCVEFFAI